MQITLGQQYNVGEKLLLFKEKLLLFLKKIRTRLDLFLFLTFNVLVANPKKTTLHDGHNPARGLLNRDKKEKEKVWQRTPSLQKDCSTPKEGLEPSTTRLKVLRSTD